MRDTTMAGESGSSITIPGTDTKVPVVVLLGGAVVVALIVILTKDNGDGEQSGDASGVLAAELDQRLREQWEGTVNLIAEAMGESGETDPTAPPSTPVEPKPVTPKPPVASKPPKLNLPVTVPGVKTEPILGPITVRPVVSTMSNPSAFAESIGRMTIGPVMSIMDNPVSIGNSQNTQSAAVNIISGSKSNTTQNGGSVSGRLKTTQPAKTAAGGAERYTLGRHEL